MTVEATGTVVLLLLGNAFQVALTTPLVTRPVHSPLSNPQPTSDKHLQLQPDGSVKIGNATYLMEVGDDGDILVVQEETGSKASVRDFCLSGEDSDDCSFVDELAFFLLEMKGTFQVLATGAWGIFLLGTGLITPEPI